MIKKNWRYSPTHKHSPPLQHSHANQNVHANQNARITYKNFTNKSTLLFILFFSAYFLVICNLYRIQIRDKFFFTQLADQQHTITTTIKPERALIFDRHHNYLAINHDCVSAFIIPNKLKTPEETITLLSHYFPHTLNKLKTKKHKQFMQKQFMYIQRKLSQEQIEMLKNSNNKDIQLLRESSRFYPIACASPIIGKTDIDNKGILGIELYYNKQLAGSPTQQLLHKDARSGYFYVHENPAHTHTHNMHANDNNTHIKNAPTSITLTIDSKLQFLVSEELKKTVSAFESQYGCALIMDPKTGEILCMATYPSFDPNSNSFENKDLTKNRIISDTYELGSIIKVFAALAALEEGVVTADELINCKNTKTTRESGRTINTTNAHGLIPFADVVALSNNIGTAIVAKRLGTSLYTHYRRLGLGTKTDIELPGQEGGFVNHPDNWSKQSIISLSYGYEVTATLLQIGTAFCLIARNGYPVSPTIIYDNNTQNTDNKNTNTRNMSQSHKKKLPKNKQLHTEQLYSDKSISTIKEILERTTQAGTTKQARIKGYRIMSKTGTGCQLVNGAYDLNKNIFTCAGIVEKNDYQRVIVTFVKDTTRKKVLASTVAAPLFREIAQKMLIHDRVI